MANKPPRAAGGCLLALSTLVGTVIGIVVHQASIGLIAGFCIGVVAAIAVAVWDSRRA
ncbi:hypothetical protein [Glacieibacterium sp.]|uniref:hypothetical protein n=1 Tax=Glacieibacterium sp. TaxID=2860237 RepID=UPI003B005D90